jgi:hypothetical protein
MRGSQSTTCPLLHTGHMYTRQPLAVTHTCCFCAAGCLLRAVQPVFRRLKWRHCQRKAVCSYSTTASLARTPAASDFTSALVLLGPTDFFTYNHIRRGVEPFTRVNRTTAYAHRCCMLSQAETRQPDTALRQACDERIKVGGEQMDSAIPDARAPPEDMGC